MTRTATFYFLLWTAAIAICAIVAAFLSGDFGDLFGAVKTTENHGGYFIIVCLYAVAGVGALSDATLRKIPNRFNYPALILALILMLVIAPLCELFDATAALNYLGANYAKNGGIALESLKGFGLCVLVGLISFAARGLGGGDVKLLATVGVLAGWQLSIAILINTLIVAAVVGVINLLLRGLLIQSLQAALWRGYLLLHNGVIPRPTTFKRTENPFCLSLLIALILLPFVNLHSYLATWLQW